MNRPFYFTLALLVAVSCAREVTPDADKSENKEYDEIEVYLTATRASVGEETGSDVKTAVGEDGTVSWEIGDRLKLITDDGRAIVTEALTTGGETATFKATVTTADVLKWAVYPSDTEAGMSDGKLSIKIPHTQDGTFSNASISAGEIPEGGGNYYYEKCLLLAAFHRA